MDIGAAHYLIVTWFIRSTLFLFYGYSENGPPWPLPVPGQEAGLALGPMLPDPDRTTMKGIAKIILCKRINGKSIKKYQCLMSVFRRSLQWKKSLFPWPMSLWLSDMGREEEKMIQSMVSQCNDLSASCFLAYFLFCLLLFMMYIIYMFLLSFNFLQSLLLSAVFSGSGDALPAVM